MILKIKLEKKYKDIILPNNCLHYFQSFIYSLMNEKTFNFYHHKGYSYEKRFFKLFNFGIENFNNCIRNKGSYIFNKNICLLISSADNNLVNEISQNLLFKSAEKINIGKNSLEIVEISKSKNKISNNSITVESIMPITVYSTLETKLGNKITIYYKPTQDEFLYYIKENLKKKWKAFNSVDNIAVDIELKEKRSIRHVLYFKNTEIEGYCTKLLLTSENLDILDFALKVGLGSKSSQGFGYIKECLND